MDTREIETKAGTFNVRVLTDVRNDRARVTVIIVNSLTSRMTLNALASFRKYSDMPTNYVVVDNFSEQWVLDDLVKVVRAAPARLLGHRCDINGQLEQGRAHGLLGHMACDLAILVDRPLAHRFLLGGGCDPRLGGGAARG